MLDLMTTGRRSMPVWKNYHLVHSIQEALELLESDPKNTRFLAGGTDLLLELWQGVQPPVATLIDITQIPELKIIELRNASLFIGAAVPLNRIVESSLVNEHAPALVEASDLIGGPQVRNAATLGGNVAHALPAADGTIALLACGAQAELASLGGVQQVKLESLFLGPRRSVLIEKHALLVGFYLPLRKPGSSSVFKRVMRPQGVALPILNMAIWLKRKDRTLEDLRLAIGPASPTPLRARGTEKVLRGQPLTEETARRALQTLHAEVRLRTSEHRASAAYRHYLVDILFYDCLMAVWERADGSPLNLQVMASHAPMMIEQKGGHHAVSD